MYADHTSRLQQVLDMPEAQAAERAQVTAQLAQTLDAALGHQRSVRDSVAQVRHAVAEASSKSDRLVARSGAQVDEGTPDAPPPGTLPDLERAASALLADLRAAESSWGWVERARQATATRTNVAPPSTGAVETSAVTETAATDTSSTGGWKVLLLLAAAVFTFLMLAGAAAIMFRS